MTTRGGWLVSLIDASGALGIDRLDHPERLIVLVPVALLPLLLALRPRRAIPWSAMREAAGAGASSSEAGPWWAAILRTLVLLCLAIVLAGPRAVRELPPRPGLGLDLVLVVDASGSMAAIEPSATEPASSPRTRLDMALEAVARFAKKRVFAGDRVGLVVFGDHAFTQCPLTTDGALLAASLRRVEVGVAGRATALGDALALAVKRATAVEGSSARAIVLLTDGRSNAGEVPVGVATALAAAAEIRVHTVGIGHGGRHVAVESAAGIRFERHDPDPDALRRIAERTGGRFFDVRSRTDLLAVYASIDEQERSERSSPPRLRERPRPEPLLAAAGCLLVIEILCMRVLSRRLP